jgi:hypothetical protein
MSADALRDICEVPILLRASGARPVVNGKYKSARKKVVSNFIKDLIACMGFLNRRLESCGMQATLRACFSSAVPGGPYEILTKASGLSQASFAKLFLIVEDDSVR